MAKTPSPKVIACYLIREALKNVPENTTAEELSTLVDSRVSDEKKDKVLEQWEKVTLSLNKKITAVISKFEGGSKPAAGKKTGGSKDKTAAKGPTEDKKKAKPLTDERVKEAKKKLGKGKNKKKKKKDDDDDE